MNEQHETRLADLAEKLADVFLDEANPAAWPGAGKTHTEQTKDERGDRAWVVKTANQVGLLFARALELRARVKWQRKADEGEENPREPLMAPDGMGGAEDPERNIERFEADATRFLERAAARR